MQVITKRIETNGIELSYDVVPREGAPVVVLIHGLTSTKESYDLMTPYLSEHYQVVRVDLRGHGASSHEGPYTFANLRAELLALLDAEGIAKATLVGGSFASVPVQQLAVAHPERVEALVLLDGGFFRLLDRPGYSLEAVQKAEPFTAATMGELVEQVLTGYGAHASAFVKAQTLREMKHRPDGRVGYATPHEAFVGYAVEYATTDLAALAPQVPVPVLVVAADHKLRAPQVQDFYVEALERYVAMVPQAEAVTIPNSLHALMITNPQETALQVHRFLAKVATSV